MTNQLLQIKVKQRINKLDSADSSNLFCWQLEEAFNKAQREWTRRQLEGINQKKEGRESSSQKVSDLQNLLVDWTAPFINKELYYESCSFPDDYLVFSRISADAIKDDCCPARRLVIYEGEESNVDVLLSDTNKRPSWTWAETFYTLFGSKVRIYTNSEFEIDNPKVIYYRKPVSIQFAGCTDSETGLTSLVDVECEFQDHIIELIIDDAVAIIAYDLADTTNAQRNIQNEQHNT